MTYAPTIRSQSDLHDAWTTLVHPLGFSRHSVWLMIIDADDRPLPQLTEIEDDGPVPEQIVLDGLAETLRILREEVVPDGRFAFLRTRPGSAGITANDRAWARALHEASLLAGAPSEVVHRASDVDLVPVPMDDLLAESA